jgi:hypothetical protein
VTTVAVIVRCGFCGSVVTREVDAGGDDDPGYCNPQHRKAAARRRARKRELRDLRYLERAVRPGPLCPKPYKMTFATTELAQAFIDVTFPDDRVIEPYPCPCGAIHIGHPSKEEK